jgi:hypothetical protein
MTARKKQRQRPPVDVDILNFLHVQHHDLMAIPASFITQALNADTHQIAW